MKNNRIIFRVDGHSLLGMGHIYNCITLAEAIPEYEPLFVLQKNSDTGIKKITETKYNFNIISGDAELDDVIDEFRPSIWVNDCLNTSKDYILHLKQKIPRVITIEDKGDGRAFADAAINALYEEENEPGVYSGWRYVCLRKEFQENEPNHFRENVKNVILMFGGTDPSNYNSLLYDIVIKISEKYPSIRFNFITGIGYDNIKNGVITNKEKRIFIYPNVPRVTKYMKEADIAITSQGRAVYELASMGVPSIVLSQNEREQTHTFAQMDHGFLNLGLKDLSPSLIGNTLDWLINTVPVRRNMYDLMLKLPLRQGLQTVKNIIVGGRLI